MSDVDQRAPSPTSPAPRPQSSQTSQNYVQTQMQLRMPSGVRESSVSMFTGLSNKDTPPPSSPGRVVSPGSIDRVFPIRSAVSIDPNATPMSRSESGEGYPGMNLGIEGTLAMRRAAHDGGNKTGLSASPREHGLPPSTGSPQSRRRSTSISQSSEGGDHRQESSRRSSLLGGRAPERAEHHAALTSILSDDAASIKSGRSSISAGLSPGSKANSIKTNEEAPLVTARFKHVVTDGGHAVITGRDGETLQRCEDEPIHIPGAVQSFGLLLAFKEDDGKLIVHVVSENSQSIIGYTPQQLFRLENFLDIFSEEQADNLLDHLDFIRDEEGSDVVNNGPEVFMVSLRPPQHRTRKLWCAMHQCATDRETIICEFEVEDDQVNPLVPRDDVTPELPEDTLGSEPTAEELAESTVNVSKPLRVLRSARKKRGEAAAMEVFNIMSQVQEQLANAPSLPIFLKVLIGVVKELTGFHRVMIYQFDQGWNGRVVAELVDPRATKDLYKGLNFPASDIPKQAREMYKVNKVRLLYNRDHETARLVCRTPEDLENPLDLTHAYLRAMSPIHIKYLGNMAVRSSMSISINAFNELWGLIACHTYGQQGMRVSFPIRKMCRLVGDTASRNIERLSYASRLQARKLINTTSSTANPSGYIVASSEDLLRLFDADVGALSIRDETKVMGNPSGHLQEVLAMTEFLRLKRLNSIYTSQDINMDFPELRYSPGLKFLAGVLYVPLSSGGNDFIAFFRKGVLQEVKWAGNPYEKFVKEGTEGYLEPRKSFKQWNEVVFGRCKDWTEEEIETASVLCLVYGKFIDVWRQKEAALQNSQLTRLLLANSAHEVRTPLNAIINYLEIALEGSLDQDTRDNLAKSHSASKSLVYVINDLLDLTKTEEHQALVKEEVFDLLHTLQEATDPFIGDAKRKNIEYVVDVDNNVPRDVVGDHRRVRQVVSNLISNAVQHTREGSVKVHAWRLDPQSTIGRSEIEISVEDTGVGMSQDKVDALFQELEEVEYEQEASAQALLEVKPAISKEDSTVKALGLGLAVVARTIRNMNGQLRLKTEAGKGSKFIIVLGFDSASTNKPQKEITGVSPGDKTPATTESTTPVQDGEVTLVKRQPSTPQRSTHGSLSRKNSTESVHSLAGSTKSGKSGTSVLSNRSDADRLIDAIQQPLWRGESGDLAADHTGPRNKVVRSQSAGDKSTPSMESPQKSKSIGSTKDLRSSLKVPGQHNVQDSGTPIRPVRMEEHEKSPEVKGMGRVKFEELEVPKVQTPSALEEEDPNAGFSVLVAEDDPINSRIMKKRLEKLGHSAYMTVNGEECSSAHGEKAVMFDAVLMDLQMPIVDGFSSTKMIRSSEKTQGPSCLSTRAAKNGRIPIFAVSASLLEKEKDKYIATGFDGWILKPVDFKRVNELLRGIVDNTIRNNSLYKPGKWEQGGWFEARSEGNHQFEIDTHPSEKAPTVEGAKMNGNSRSQLSDAGDGDSTPTGRRRSRSEDP
ncbi:hypothetical protein LTR64_003627 [Lithohypha guttulata]|uniref:Phytochrome n=1 Tax=Lithohypha guttulata TaxID=1690604 RepID=A0AAN7SZ31_9EURO|nr:hypothetical protein LTR51_000153 [Lithohypha guttulata]KAK5085347.1 hypothetical protein LTR05_004631 [Lithohypha guttulata]